MLAGSVVARCDEIGVFYSHFCWVFGSLILHLGHDEVFGVREALRFRTNEHKIADLLWVSECNAQRNISTVSTDCALSASAARKEMSMNVKPRIFMQPEYV